MGDATAPVRTEICCTIVRDLIDDGDPGVDLLHIKADVRISLVIFQQDVVFWHMALYQGTFQNERFEFAGRDDHIEMVDLTDHEPRFRCMGSGVLKILRYPILQFFCFADIYDLICFIPHDINTGGIRKAQRFFL